MYKRFVALCAAIGLLASAAWACTYTTTDFVRLQGRYPEAIVINSTSEDSSLENGVLIRRAEYLTSDEFSDVQSWYVAHLEVDAGSDTNNLVAGNCAWLTREQQVYVLSRNVSVIVCSARSGTRIFVNESVYLWP